MCWQKQKNFFIFILLFFLLPVFLKIQAQAAEFNPNFIISDSELWDHNSLSFGDIQKFLDARGSYLYNYKTTDASGTIKTAAEIIYDAAQNYRINPKYILVTLQKEQSLITDDSPTEKQLNWAAGYAVCDSCQMDDPKIQKFKGFGKQVDSTASIMRWYNDNREKNFIKKKDSVTNIDEQEVIPGSWATAFLYTYTPHLHGNKNFWRIWNTWFSQLYPNGSLLKTTSSTDVWLIQNGQKRKFKNMTVLISRADPEKIIIVPETELNNYALGAEITLPNYSVLKTPNNNYYLLDYDVLRPFANEETVRQLGYNPQEIITIEDSTLNTHKIGTTITAATLYPAGIIYQITDLDNAYYLVKDDVVYPLLDPGVIQANFKNLNIVKKQKKDIQNLTVNDWPINFIDGTLLQVKDTNYIYVIENGQKRKITDKSTFAALGYKTNNIINVKLAVTQNIPDGEPLYLNTALLNAENKFLGDAETEVVDQLKSVLPSYLVAEYPSGRIISGKNIDQQWPIASLAKLVIAYEALNQNFDPKKATVYSTKKYSSEGNPLSLTDGEKINNNDLLHAMLIASVNNTARMVAQASGLSEAQLIKNANLRLSEWGADNTVLADVTGLDAGNLSTARDLLKIFTQVLTDKSLKNIINKTEYTFKELVNKNKIATHNIKTTNKIIAIANRKYRVLASKTGYTDAAQAVLVMLVESRSTKKQYVIITMHNPNYNKRFDEPNRIANLVAAGKVKIANLE